MKLLTFKYQNKEMTGIKDDYGVLPFIGSPSLLSIIESGVIPEVEKEPILYKDIEFLAPIPRPKHDLICLGLNYVNHVEEMKELAKSQHTQKAIYFGKRCYQPAGHNQDVKIGITEEFDYENELAVIIKDTCRNVKKEDASKHIFGFSVANDYSARDIQNTHGQWYLGKSGDSHLAMGPWIVTIDEIGYPLEKTIMTMVNGEVRQEANTKLMIHHIDEVIEEISTYITLEAGDIILTGTPSGVVAGHPQYKYLQAGDEVDCMIDGIGVLHNHLVE